MLATMLPAHIHQQHHAVSRPDSRASSCASSAASPTRARAHRSTNAAAVPSSSKSSAQRAQPGKASAKGGESGDGASVPGLITLSKPLSATASSSSPLASPANNRRKNKSNAAVAATEGNAARGRTPSSTPPREGEQDAAATAKAKRTKQRSKNKKGVPAALNLNPVPSASLLSQSAPSSSANKDATKSHRPLPSAREEAAPQWDTPLASAAASAAALTWQQEMLNSIAPKGAADANKSNGDVSSKRDSSLTWQQALLGQAKSTGPHFDFFADDRDIATFGSNDEQAAVGPAPRTRARAGSVGNSKAKARTPAALDDVFASSSSSPRQPYHNGYISDKAKVQVVLGSNSPSTPNKSKSSQGSSSSPLGNAAQLGGFAYAGPNFHNSPSPASLPMPKFNTRTGSSRTLHVSHGSTSGSSSLAGESTSSSSASEDEDDLAARKARGTTAPPELMSTPAKTQCPPVVIDRTATIESLLAKMMAPPRAAGI